VFLADGDWERHLPALSRLRRFVFERSFQRTAQLPLPGGVLDLLLDPANASAYASRRDNLMQRSALAGAFRHHMARRYPDAVALHELLTLDRPLSLDRALQLFPHDLLEELVAARALDADGEIVRSNVLALPFRGLLFLSDPVRLQGHPDYVYAGRTSFTPADHLAAAGWRGPRAPADSPRRLLDLGCGAGFTAVAAAAAEVERVVGTDIVERCLRFARLNAELNGVANSAFHYSDVVSDVDGEFELVVSNAPCVWDALQEATFATGGGDFGTALPARMIAGGLEHLDPTGVLIAVVAGPVIDGRPYIVEALERACAGYEVEIRIHPEFAEYAYGHWRTYRRHHIQKFVRYLAAITHAPRSSISFARSDRLRFGSYRMRSAAVRAAAAVARPA
jgi:SAM-dependent methyltransferase